MYLIDKSMLRAARVSQRKSFPIFDIMTLIFHDSSVLILHPIWYGASNLGSVGTIRGILQLPFFIYELEFIAARRGAAS
jgi:hypothetical protein